MHDNTLRLMKYFIQWHLKGGETVLDIGSYDINGSCKSLFIDQVYTGADIEKGPNVDIVIKPYDFGTTKYDVVISTNCLEHVEMPWEWVKAFDKTVKKGGLICIITPINIGIHRFPVDCWRIMPDGYEVLFTKVVKGYEILRNESNYGDCFFIARKC